jgi:hypothetical protein
MSPPDRMSPGRMSPGRMSPDCLELVAVRVLQGLRAGPLDRTTGDLRFGTGFYLAIQALMRSGWVAKSGAGRWVYQITEAGLLACPLRNPAAGRPRAWPEMGAGVRGPSWMRAGGGRYME